MVSDILTAVVLAKARTHYPNCPSLRDVGAAAFFNNRTLWLWVLAFRQDDASGTAVDQLHLPSSKLTITAAFAIRIGSLPRSEGISSPPAIAFTVLAP